MMLIAANFRIAAMVRYSRWCQGLKTPTHSVGYCLNMHPHGFTAFTISVAGIRRIFSRL